jgi:hypothetical protein
MEAAVGAEQGAQQPLVGRDQEQEQACQGRKIRALIPVPRYTSRSVAGVWRLSYNTRLPHHNVEFREHVEVKTRRIKAR